MPATRTATSAAAAVGKRAPHSPGSAMHTAHASRSMHLTHTKGGDAAADSSPPEAAAAAAGAALPQPPPQLPSPSHATRPWRTVQQASPHTQYSSRCSHLPPSDNHPHMHRFALSPHTQKVPPAPSPPPSASTPHRQHRLLRLGGYGLGDRGRSKLLVSHSSGVVYPASGTRVRRVQRRMQERDVRLGLWLLTHFQVGACVGVVCVYVCMCVCIGLARTIYIHRI